MEFEGRFGRMESAGQFLAVVCRSGGDGRRYFCRVVEVQDGFLNWHLRESGLFGPLVPIRLADGTEADEVEEAEGELQPKTHPRFPPR